MRRAIKTFFLSLSAIFIPFLLFSAEEGVSHGGEWKSFVFKLINFIIFLLLLLKFSKKPISNLLKERKKAIQEKLKEARAALEEAETTLEEYKKRIANLEAEMEEIKKRYVEEGEREKKRLIEEAKREVERIKKEAEELIEEELRKAEETLRKRGVEIALEVAESILRKKTTKEDNKRLVQEFLTLVGGKN